MGVNMCGICGFYRKTSISMEQLKYMNDSMVHRGPDDSGELIFGGGKKEDTQLVLRIEDFQSSILHMQDISQCLLLMEELQSYLMGRYTIMVN